jgi:uncharacterized membrane protein YcaP (DUF421 family)
MGEGRPCHGGIHLPDDRIGPDDSIIGGLIGATTLFVVNEILGVVTFESPRLERLIEGEPRTLVRGHVSVGAR